MYMRASELREFLHFHIKKLLFLSIFFWYFRNFVGTNDTLVGLHVPTDFQMYRQNYENALLGGGGAIAPPPPLATLVPPTPLSHPPCRKTMICSLFDSLRPMNCLPA